MTEASFRTLALSRPGTTESSHMGHSDFRVKGKIFATLPFEGDDDAKGNVPGGVVVVKLTPDQQDEHVERWPKAFEPVPGAWGQRGFTRVLLAHTTKPVARRALQFAFENIPKLSPKRTAKRQRPPKRGSSPS